MKRTIVVFFLALSCCSSVLAQESVDAEVNTVLREQGLENSQVMEFASWMCDVYGPRLTGSPMLDKATEWAMETLKEMDLSNVHLEEWGPFGRGWELQHFEMHATAPSYLPILGYPKAWSPSTDGPVRGEVIYLEATTVEDLEQYRGKIGDKFVLLDTIRSVKQPFEPLAQRRSDENLLRMANAGMPTPRPSRNYDLSGFSFNRALWKFLTEEQPLAVMDRSYKGDLGTVFVSGARAGGEQVFRPYQEDAEVVPQVTLAIEHYNRIFRMIQKEVPVELSLDLQTRFTNPDGMEHNIIAEIPGTDLSDEVVMFGAHFDSWHTATGATDNGAGSSVMMEVARLLQEVIAQTGKTPRRTLRLALWTGEEQGLYGSRAYVRQNFAATSPEGALQNVKPAQDNISAYYNLDNGTGKVRGVYLQGNAAVEPIFRAWLQPWKDLGAATLTLSNTGGTDHLAFDAVGIPGFQFIQDPIAYFARTHHSNMDSWDQLSEEDLAQAATVIASFVWHTAQRDDKLPRKPIATPKDDVEKPAERR